MASGVLLATLPASAQDETTTTTAPPETTTTAPPETTTTAAPTETSAPADPPAEETTTAPSAAPSTLSQTQRQAKAEATGALNAAVADDAEIASALRDLNDSVQQLQSQVDDARRRLEEAQETERTAAEEVATSSEQQAVIEQQLSVKAVEAFKGGTDDTGMFFTDGDVTDTLRGEYLLAVANKTTGELLEELRTLREDSEAAQAEAAQAAADAEALDTQLTADLAELQEQQDAQLSLKREAESRIARWESELSAYAAQDESIKSLISGSAPTDAPPVNRAGTPSAQGFQWPVNGPVTSPYGYRVHPVYGTRKLHSGMDISAPSGTPIAAAADGTVIFVGVQGGYGNTVIVDHGGGVTTLYGHMSSFSTSQGATVSRGDVLGGVGQTGTATGNHLHFEVRINGSTTDPAPYLP